VSQPLTGPELAEGTGQGRGRPVSYVPLDPEAFSHSLAPVMSAWRDQLKAAIRDKGPTLALRRPQQDVRVVADFPLEWTSEHDRQSTSRPVTIYHILASFMDTDKGGTLR